MTREIESILVRFKGGEYHAYRKGNGAIGDSFDLAKPTRRGRLVHYQTGPTCGECWSCEEEVFVDSDGYDCKCPGGPRGVDKDERHESCPAPGGVMAWKGE